MNKSALSRMTLGDIRQRRLWLRLYCDQCQHNVLIPYRMLPPRLPDDLPDDLAAAHFRCSACGSKQLRSALEDAMAM